MEPRELLYQRLLEGFRFVRWVTGEAPEDDNYWPSWVANNPVRQEVMAQARLTILTIQGRPVTLLKQEIADRVQPQIDAEKHRYG